MMTPLDKVLDNAFNAYNLGELDLAENLTREVLSADKNQPDALYLLSLIAYRRGAPDAAIDILFQLVKSYPTVENYLLFLASVLQEQGRYSEALKYYQKCPNNAKGLAQQGFIYLNQNKKSLAKNLFQQALDAAGNLPEARLGMALCQQDKEKLRQIAVDTDLPDAWFYLSRFYQENHNDKMALQAIEKTGLKTASYLIEQGVILERLNQPDKAIKAYQAAAEINPYRSDIWTNQANIFRKNNELDAAENYYKRALAQNADDMITRHNLASLLFQMDRIAESLEQYRYILSHNPTDTTALYNLAIILEKTGEWAEALGLYFKLLIEKENISDLDWRIADSIAALAEQGKSSLKLATDFAKGWMKIASDNPVAQHTYAALTQTPEKDIIPYIRRLYDSFAPTYQDKMIELHATAVTKVLSIIPKKTYKKVLDLGCGTGLFGKSFAKNDNQITGVDISSKMLEKAKETKCYTKLLNTDIISFLDKNRTKFDLISAIEVLEYCPNLEAIFSKIKPALTPDGLFVFTIELSEKDTHLAPNGRYLYSYDYVIEKLNKYGLKVRKATEIQLRKEQHGFAMGRIFICNP